MLKANFRKLSVKLLTLAMLLGCLVFISSPTRARVDGPDCPACNTCDSNFTACRNNATTGEEAVACQDNYSSCLNDCGYYDVDGCANYGERPHPFHVPYQP